MLTKIPILLLTLLLSVPAFAQQPRIDSIAVDEDKGELVLHGSFQNYSSAIVLVDSVSLAVTLASDTLIMATIPLSGKGSAGEVRAILYVIKDNYAMEQELFDSLKSDIESISVQLHNFRNFLIRKK